MANLRCIFAALTAILLCACRKEEVATVHHKPLPIQLVYSAEVEPIVTILSSQFAQTAVVLPNNTRVSIEPIKETPIAAAQKISTGEIKGHLWIAPSTALVNYVNTNLVNLGARQTECAPLFSSPIVGVVKSSQLASLGANNQTMKFSALLGDRAPEEAPIGLSHGIPGNSESGLGAIALLQAYQAAKLPGSIIDEVERLTQVERRINNYSEDEQFLLDRANSSPSQIVSVVLASEQQYVKYTKAHSAATLSPVYFDEPTFFQDYQLCVSASDWVTPAHKAAIDIIKKAALSAGIQQQAAELGFRPIAVSSESLAPYRVRTNLKLKQLPSPEGTMVSSILNQWETYSKPLALTILIQTSLSFPAEIFSVVQNSLHHFLSNKKSSTRVTLIGYANGTKSFATLSTDNHELASQMTLLQPQAGDTLYDGLRKAFEASLDETSLGFRRRLVILTTGRDAGSQADYDGLLSYATTKLSKEDLDVVALVAKVEGVDSSEFEQFIRQLGGNVRSASRDNVFDLLRAVF